MNQKTKLLLIALALVVLLAAGGIFYSIYSSGDGEATPAPSQTPSASQTKAPVFTVLNTQNKEVSLSDLQGKPTVINFWATWCGYCKVEMPAFEAMYQKYGNRVNFMMVDLTDGMQETQSLAKSYIAQEGYSFPIYFDTTGQAMQLYNAYSIPLTVLVDAEGNLIQKHSGAMNEATLENYILNLLGGK